MLPTPIRHCILGMALSMLFAPGQAAADSRPATATVSPPIPYADLADLADAAPLIVRVQPRKLVRIEAERARGVSSGLARFYVEARTEAVVFGRNVLGEKVSYLVDLPLDAKGKPPAIKKKSAIVFTRPVAGRPGELQLVSPDAQLLWDAGLDTRLRAILDELSAADTPQRVIGVREAIHVTGDLAGSGETQMFLATAKGEPMAITVSRSPGQAVAISISFSELVGGGAGVPPRDTLAWYRLACFLPRALPASANISPAASDRAAAAVDYRLVLDRLGSCARERK